MANNVFQVKRTNVSGRTPNTTGSYATNTQYIAAGEFALNMADGILYSSNGSAVIEIGANNTNQRITNSLTINNNKNLNFATVNTSAAVSFIQQSDDNFVMYTTNTAYGQRAVWSIFANSITSEFSFSAPVRFNANVTALVANGTTGTAGQVLATNGSAVYWVSPGAASVNTAAQFTWSNLHTFQANVAFTGNGIGITSNTGAIYLGGLADANWRIGRNTGATTKWRYTNNSIDIITANSNLEGMAIGLIGGNSYFETGYLGTFIASNVTIGNTSSNSTINSTAFSGSSNSATYLGSVGNFGNSSGIYTSGVSNSATLSTGTTFIANATQVTFAVPLSANGGTGTSGQVLTSNGATGSPYWSTVASGGGVYMKGGSATVGTLGSEGQNIFRVNANTLNNNTTIAAGENAQATGPIAVAAGITLTVETGARVSIV